MAKISLWDNLEKTSAQEIKEKAIKFTSIWIVLSSKAKDKWIKKTNVITVEEKYLFRARIGMDE